MFQFLKSKGLKTVMTAHAVIIALQIVFGGIFDIATNLLILAMYFGVSQIDTLEAWWKGNK